MSAQGQGDVKQSSLIGFSQGMEPDLCAAMFFILQNQQRLIEKHLFSF
jgi:hypothetical protein